MQRVVIYLRRRPDLLRARFVAWWLEQHRGLAEQLPGLRQYTISLAVDDEDGPFDGMAELWFDNLAAADAAFASPAGRSVGADAVAHVARLESLNLTDHTIIDNPTPPRFKYTAGLKRRADMSREAFARWWLERHVPYVKQFPAIRKYRVSLSPSWSPALRPSSMVSPRSGLTTWRRCGALPQARWSRKRSGTRLLIPAPASGSSSTSIASASCQTVFPTENVPRHGRSDGRAGDRAPGPRELDTVRECTMSIPEFDINGQKVLIVGALTPTGVNKLAEEVRTLGRRRACPLAYR
jgi:uncharacterized protein (TIGR02118 family)